MNLPVYILSAPGVDTLQLNHLKDNFIESLQNEDYSIVTNYSWESIETTQEEIKTRLSFQAPGLSDEERLEFMEGIRKAKLAFSGPIVIAIRASLSVNSL